MAPITWFDGNSGGVLGAISDFLEPFPVRAVSRSVAAPADARGEGEIRGISAFAFISPQER